MVDHTSAHALQPSSLLKWLDSTEKGLSPEQVTERVKTYGRNEIPAGKVDHFLIIFARQFVSPLIYLLVVAVILSLWLGHQTDAIFIFAVILFNSAIGSSQEYLAQQNVLALRAISPSHARCRRQGEIQDISTEEIVPGDIVLIESGEKIPADLRIIKGQALDVDESLLTGESVAVQKSVQGDVAEDALIAERSNMLHAGTFVLRGRAEGIATATGLRTELGKIANEVLKGATTQTPLMIRMELFTRWLAIGFVIASFCIGLALFIRGDSLVSIVVLAVALGVGAIPEGLPVALTIALSIASRRMANKKVIVRKLASVEALGSCTYIGSDKTGTLTLNKLKARNLVLPSGIQWSEGDEPASAFAALLDCFGLCNEAHKVRGKFIGDPVDVALLELGEVYVWKREQSELQLVGEIAYESELQLAARLYRDPSGNKRLYVKGAAERVLSFCREPEESRQRFLSQIDDLSAQGYKVLVGASSDYQEVELNLNSLKGLEYLGAVGLLDPPREDAKEAIEAAHRAGIAVAMITGDHPLTALATAKELGLASSESEVITGRELQGLSESTQLASRIKEIKVFARVEPTQKSLIVSSLKELGHFVAITGDGANDAPALRAAHVGVAMGLRGTEVAKESSDLIISDDRFSSIIDGIKEGRVAYNNIRKVVYLLIATGVAEIILFTLSVAAGYPLPLTPVQLLWLNLVTNGIQDVALAFEPAEGDELLQKPRPPQEGVFNQIMLERVILSAATMGTVSFLAFWYLLDSGMNLVLIQSHILLLMVLFENIMIGNAKSERKSAFRINPLKNPILLGGAILAQAVHLIASYIPGLNEVLGVEPIAVRDWFLYLFLSLSVLLVIEVHKFLRNPSKAQSSL